MGHRRPSDVAERAIGRLNGGVFERVVLIAPGCAAERTLQQTHDVGSEALHS